MARGWQLVAKRRGVKETAGAIGSKTQVSLELRGFLSYEITEAVGGETTTNKRL
ncbi:MAG: hypothetical protein LBO72_02000 [Helicobacteraceae bacterium]|jgi:hypothetical protein|nr:hypothetical protein [Helicobacteraceae bacterium]